MKKVEIEFPVNFTDNKPGVIPLGRIQLGPYIGRLVFCANGTMKLAIDKNAVDEGFVILTDYKEGMVY